MTKPQLEKQIERRARRAAESSGKRMMKFVSPNHAFVPDDIVMAPIPELIRPVIAQYFRFAEFKRTGAKPTVAQQREHERLRAMGFVVEVLDNIDDVDRMFKEMG